MSTISILGKDIWKRQVDPMIKNKQLLFIGLSNALFYLFSNQQKIWFNPKWTKMKYFYLRSYNIDKLLFWRRGEVFEVFESPFKNRKGLLFYVWNAEFKYDACKKHGRAYLLTFYYVFREEWYVLFALHFRFEIQ